MTTPNKAESTLVYLRYRWSFVAETIKDILELLYALQIVVISREKKDLSKTDLQKEK